MSTEKRLRDVERGLTVQEIVRLHIEEYRRFPSMFAHARSLIGVRTLPDTICSRIERSVTEAQKGRPAAALNQMTRAAQRDGLFLAKLARKCDATIALRDRERRLEFSLLWALLALTLQDRGGAERAAKAPGVAGKGPSAC